MVVFLSRLHLFSLSMDELTMSLSKRVGERESYVHFFSSVQFE